MPPRERKRRHLEAEFPLSRRHHSYHDGASQLDAICAIASLEETLSKEHGTLLLQWRHTPRLTDSCYFFSSTSKIGTKMLRIVYLAADLASRVSRQLLMPRAANDDILPPLKFNDNGTFQMSIFSDMHFGQCKRRQQRFHDSRFNCR